MERELILYLKEKKYNLIKEYLLDYQVVTLTPNIPGLNKNTYEAKLLLEIFDKEIDKLNPLNCVKFNDEYPYNIYLFNKGYLKKENLVKIEEEHGLGRFVDIDLYNDIKSESRGVLRKCYLCSKPAFICRKENNHSEEDLLYYIKNTLNNFIGEKLASLAYYSTIEELKLNPKFGLVSYESNGSHADMNAKLMDDSIKSIVPFFKEIYLKCLNVNDLTEVRMIAKEIGLKAEEKMFEVTGGINTYKGLIFHLGLIIASISHRNSHLFENVFTCDIIKVMCKDIFNEFITPLKTQGVKSFDLYKITGARGIAKSGYEIVFNSLDEFDLESDNSKLEYLAYLVSNIDDTVLLKRCGSIEKYNDVRKMFKDFKIEDLNKLTEYMIQNNFSIGGAADLLIVAIFIKNVKKIINI